MCVRQGDRDVCACPDTVMSERHPRSRVVMRDRHHRNARTTPSHTTCSLKGWARCAWAVVPTTAMMITAGTLGRQDGQPAETNDVILLTVKTNKNNLKIQINLQPTFHTLHGIISSLTIHCQIRHDLLRSTMSTKVIYTIGLPFETRLCIERNNPDHRCWFHPLVMYSTHIHRHP